MDSYQFLEELGEGGFGKVQRAMDIETGALLAIKTMNKEYTDFAQVIQLKEVQSLMILKHVNIISLFKVIKEGSKVHLVFNWVKESLLKRLENGPIPPLRVRAIAYQLLQGVAYIHSMGVVHRDLKPENVLVSKDQVIKICDFGLSRNATDTRPGSTYIATRWYRAPELLLHDKNCDYKAVDIWSTGAMICELYTGLPVFAGKEGRQLEAIEKVKGTPTAEDWPHGLVLAASCRYNFINNITPKDWIDVVPQAPFEACQLLDELLNWDPDDRCSASDGLSFPLFEVSMLQ